MLYKAYRYVGGEYLFLHGLSCFMQSLSRQASISLLHLSNLSPSECSTSTIHENFVDYFLNWIK